MQFKNNLAEMQNLFQFPQKQALFFNNIHGSQCKNT